MTGKISTQTATHDHWGNGEDGWHLVCNPALSINSGTHQPGWFGTAPVPLASKPVFHGLSGALWLEIAGAVILARLQEGIEVPAGVPHHVQNRSQTDVHFLVTSQPPSHGDRITA